MRTREYETPPGERPNRFEPIFDPWDEHQVPDLPSGCLPEVVEQFAAGNGRLIGCDASALAMACLATMGCALDHQFVLKLMRNGSWWASARLWVLLSGDPSQKKTAAINAATRGLEDVQSEALAAWAEEMKRHKAAGGKEEDGPSRPTRYVASDTTTEKLGEILSRQNRGLLVKRDEISGWIGSMERYSSGRHRPSSDRAFWLQAFDGGPFCVNRISRGEIVIHNLSVGIVGGIQPERLAEFKGLTTDGLLQRLVPVVLKAASFPVDAPDGGTSSAYGRLIRALISAQPAKLLLGDDALAQMEALRKNIFDIEQASGGLASGFSTFAGKLPGIAGALALILHMADDPNGGAYERVRVNIVERVARIVREFILPHAFEFYRSAETVTDGDRLKRLASWILTSGQTRIVPSDLAHNVAGFRGLGLGDIAQRVSPLVAGGWLSPEGSNGIVCAWKVEPAVRAQLADRARSEDERKAALASLMRSPRKGANEP